MLTIVVAFFAAMFFIFWIAACWQLDNAIKDIVALQRDNNLQRWRAEEFEKDRELAWEHIADLENSQNG